MFLQTTLTVIVLGGGLLGCTKDEMKVETYRTPKQSMSQSAVASHEEAPPSVETPPSFGWDIPAGWKVQPTSSSMKLASFSVMSNDDKANYEASIIALSGEAGGMIANVNRWREQVGIAAENEDAIRKSARVGKSAIGSFQWFEIINPNIREKAMLVAILPAGDQTLFVKLMAPRGVLSRNQEKFLSLCRSLRKTDR